MDLTEKEFEAAKKQFTDSLNALSDEFIRFSLAANALNEVLKRLKDHNPTLFDTEDIQL